MTEFRRAADAIATRISEDQVVAMDVNAADYFGLEGPAAFVWDLLESPRTLDSIVESLLDRYEVDEATCRAQAEGFLADMVDRQLAVVSE